MYNRLHAFQQLPGVKACHKSWCVPVCEPISGLYRDFTPIQAMAKSRAVTKCCLELLYSWFLSTSSEKLKLPITVDDLSDRLWIAGITLELHVEDRAVGTPKIEFSVNKS